MSTGHHVNVCWGLGALDGDHARVDMPNTYAWPSLPCVPGERGYQATTAFTSSAPRVH
jgi:hypothetical protein